MPAAAAIGGSLSMTHPKPMGRAEVEAALERAGLRLSPAQLDEIHSVSGYITQLVERIGRDRPTSAEPALTFTPVRK